MSSLKLITTEKFGSIPCDFYRNMNDDILLTREQIGSALEYANPDDALSKIHRRHKDRLDQLSVIAKLSSTDGKEYNTHLYTERGIMEICRWSNKPKANQFMDWCWDIVTKYRQGEINNINLQPLLDAIASLTVAVTSMQQDLQILIQSSSTQRQLPRKRYFSRWTNKMMPKYQLLMDYLHVDRKELYHNLFMELQNLYPDIDLAQTQDDFCFENNIDSCFTMDVIEHTKSLRDIFEHMVDSILNQYGLTPDSPAANTNKTIFH